MWKHVQVERDRLVRPEWPKTQNETQQAKHQRSMMDLSRFVTLIAASALLEGVSSNSYTDALPETEYDFTICKSKSCKERVQSWLSMSRDSLSSFGSICVYFLICVKL